MFDTGQLSPFKAYKCLNSVTISLMCQVVATFVPSSLIMQQAPTIVLTQVQQFQTCSLAYSKTGKFLIKWEVADTYYKFISICTTPTNGLLETTAQVCKDQSFLQSLLHFMKNSPAVSSGIPISLMVRPFCGG
jgi:hypothetical protein